MGVFGVLAQVGKKVIGALPDSRNVAEDMARQILELRAAGRADEVTDEMMDLADDPYMFENTPIDMSQEARMARADEMFPIEAFHETSTDFTEFDPFRRGAGDGDPEMPTGVFTKPTAETIGLGGETEIQMPLRINKGKNLTVKNRDEMAKAINDLDAYNGDYFKARNDFHRFDNETAEKYNAVFEGAIGKEFLNRDPERYFEESEKFINFWDSTLGAMGHRARYLLDETIRDENYNPIYDSFTVLKDKGSLGNVETTVTIDPSNVRSKFARFDPEFRHLQNLSAGFSAIGFSGLAAGLKEKEKGGGI